MLEIRVLFVNMTYFRYFGLSQRIIEISKKNNLSNMILIMISRANLMQQAIQRKKELLRIRKNNISYQLTTKTIYLKLKVLSL